jgi:protein-S-isoprenylcysteine O-methyltransferase
LILFQSHALILLYMVLLGLFLSVEAALILRRRSREGRAPEDSGFRARALLVFLVTNLVAIVCLRLFPAVSFGTLSTSCLGLALLAAGLLLRWWSVIHLGRFFTPDVVIAADHRVIDTGPYRLIRHPSYTGVLLVIAGVSLCFGNLASALVLVVPNLALLMQRMRIEEAALSRGLGEPYRAYMSRTKRLIPGVY